MESVRGKCDSCGMENAEIKPYRIKNDERRNLCNRPMVRMHIESYYDTVTAGGL
jgi:hypothetical protein